MIVNLRNIKKHDLNENKGNVASDPKAKKLFFNTIQLVSLDTIKS